MTKVLSPVIERSLHSSSMKPFFWRFWMKFFITASAPFKYRVIWPLYGCFTIIPMRFVSLLKGKMFRISYFNYFPEGNSTVMSVWVRDFNMMPNFYTILTKVISSGLEAWKSFSRVSFWPFSEPFCFWISDDVSTISIS